MNGKLSAKEAGLLEAGRIYGKEVEDALRAHLSIIDERFYFWMADLYLPRNCKCENFDEDATRVCLLPRDEKGECICTGGGFYVSNSARDNEQFKIDIESTVQAIRSLSSFGMLENYDGDFRRALPKQMQNDIIAFAKSLQDKEDGYFYHSQWGKNITPSRQGRDLGWATSILAELGDAPLYDTKNGYKGSLGTPSGVPKIADNSEEKNSTWISHLQTLDAFKEYLNSFDLKNKSYSSCNNINAQTSQINARDKQAMEDGEAHDENGDGIAEDGFVAALEHHFNERQNAENGLWEDGVYYSSVNGLMKISSSYNAMNLKFNYAEAAFESAVKIALLPADEADLQGKFAMHSVDVYNPWVAMRQLMLNVKKFGTAEEYERLKMKLKHNAATLIKITTEKTKKFKKEDGSFGYHRGGTSGTSQGAPVCLPNVNEGSINGGLISTRGIFGNMCDTLSLKIPIFSGNDYEKFISIIKKKCGYK